MTGDIHVTWLGDRQVFAVASAREPVDPASFATGAYGRIADLLTSRRMSVVHERLFGSCDAAEPVMRARRDALAAKGISPDSPTSYIQGHPPWGTGLAGVIVRAAPRGAVFGIRDQGRACGRGWRDGRTTYLLLQNIQAQDRRNRVEGPDQTRQVIARARRILEEHGARYTDTVRTWFYLADILSWYGPFNRVRTAAYRQLGLMSGQQGEKGGLPASTGVAGATPGTAAVVMDLLAIAGHRSGDDPKVQRLTNSAQMEAPEYGSAFARAVCIEDQGAHLLELSGTAAIDGLGRTVAPNSASRQVEATFDNIVALLRGTGATLAHMAAATGFVKSGADAPLFWNALERRGLRPNGWVCVKGDLCRPDLLFEIDGELVW